MVTKLQFDNSEMLVWVWVCIIHITNFTHATCCLYEYEYVSYTLQTSHKQHVKTRGLPIFLCLNNPQWKIRQH